VRHAKGVLHLHPQVTNKQQGHAMSPSTQLQALLHGTAHQPATIKATAKGAAAAGPLLSHLLSGSTGLQGRQPAGTPAQHTSTIASSPTFEFTGAAVSDDGQTIVIVPAIKSIFVSRDGGTTFTAKPIARPWLGVAISASGQRISAVIAGGEIYSSNDYGENWSIASVPLAFWTSIASDNSGQNLVACALQLLTVSNTTIYVSADGGSTWQERAEGLLSSNAWSFITVASNGDGTRLLASAADIGAAGNPATGKGGLYSSADGGGSWSKVDVPAASWLAVAAAEAY
jgi:photosystem II stability/assembly factor-like uncharacterized protein